MKTLEQSEQQQTKVSQDTEDPETIRTTANSLTIPFPMCPRQKMPWGDLLPQHTWAGDILGFPALLL